MKKHLPPYRWFKDLGLMYLELRFRIMDDSGIDYRMHDSNFPKNQYRQIKLAMQMLDRYHPEGAKCFNFLD